MSVAKAQLAALMNVPPTERFTLSGRASSVRTRVFREPLDELVAVALVNRPELREAQYNSRINVQESKVALLQLLQDGHEGVAVNQLLQLHQLVQCCVPILQKCSHSHRH